MVGAIRRIKYEGKNNGRGYPLRKFGNRLHP